MKKERETNKPLDESDIILKLQEASMMALGWMCAKAPVTDPVIVFLARTLKKSGTDSGYVDEIVARADREGR